jgi:hypothetical protein
VHRSEILTLFSPYKKALEDPLVAELAYGTCAWFLERSDSDGREPVPRLITVACVYARLCAPASATLRSYEVAARFTFLFFLVDDAERPELAEGPWAIGRFSPALAAWRGELSEAETASPSLLADLERSFHDYLQARRREHLHDSRALTVEQHWALRRRTIFMDPYLDHWMISLAIDPNALDAAGFREARQIGTDVVLLSNDLGSIDRDKAGGQSPDDLNLVDSYAREEGTSRADAVTRLIGLHNELVGRFRDALGRACTARPGPHAERYADLLSGVVDGNLASLHALDFRYRNVEHVLAALERVRQS